MLDLIKAVEDQGLKSNIFQIEDIKSKLDAQNIDPYQNVFLQEIEYMNALLFEITRSLDEIDQGLKGILTVSEKMEQIILAVSLNRVPTSWSVLAYPSKRGLSSWLLNL